MSRARPATPTAPANIWAKGRDPSEAVTFDEAVALDAADPLAFARERFVLPDRSSISTAIRWARCPRRRRHGLTLLFASNGAATSSPAGTSTIGLSCRPGLPPSWRRSSAPGPTSC
jgi:hypothetical protein